MLKKDPRNPCIQSKLPPENPWFEMQILALLLLLTAQRPRSKLYTCTMTGGRMGITFGWSFRSLYLSHFYLSSAEAK